MKSARFVFSSMLTLALLFSFACDPAYQAPKERTTPNQSGTPKKVTEAPQKEVVVQKVDPGKGTILKTTAVLHISQGEEKLGTIELEFFPDAAPKHVENFLNLAAGGFYNGTKFHRVIPGFMIQGGDPNSRSDNRSTHGRGFNTDKSGQPVMVKNEFNAIPHKRGILSMARGGHPDSASCQFFIVVADSPFLDNQYTVFGQVKEGMDTADKVVSVARDRADNPMTPVMIDKVEIRDN